MAENSITIHQAFYGEVNRAHSCIKQTITDPELTSFLITFTDRPAALPPGVNLMPYLSGSAFSKYYIFTKTFPDQTATRAGMVFTHVLILNQSDVNSINNLQDVFSHFVSSTENKNDELKETLVECSNSSPVSGGINQPKYIQQTISNFINNVSPILFSGEIETFRNALQQIWNSPNIGARKKIKFRASFTPSDIVNISDLTIVLIQKDFLSKWQGQSIIYGEHQESVEITSHSEALFLGFKEANPFHSFLVELNVNLSEVQNYSQYEKVYSNFISIEKIVDANILRQDIRVLSKISPTPTDGKTIKEKFIERLSLLIKNKKDTNIKALRNIDWSGYIDGERKGKQIVSEFIESEIENPNLNPNQFENLLDIIAISAVDEEKNWWHDAVRDAVVMTFKKESETSAANLWQLIDLSVVRLIYIMSIIGSVKDCDKILRKFLPKNLKIETLQAIAKIALKKNWYLLHADLLLKQLSTEEALAEQLKVEDKLELIDSTGVNYIVKKLPSDKLIVLTLRMCHKKLIELSIEAIIRDATLLSHFDLKFSCWREIWTSVVLKTGKIFNGLAGKEQAVVFSVFDLILEGKVVNDILVGLIVDSGFADISEYKNRSKVWGTINHLHRDKLLAITTQGILKKLLSGKIEISTIEIEVSNRITSDDFMTKFLSENRNDIEPVLTLFSSFRNLKDNSLADYIRAYRGAISDVQAKNLGVLVSISKFSKSARSIYDKYKNNSSFGIAYEECKNLVNLTFFEMIWELPSGHSTQGKVNEVVNQKSINCILVVTATDKETTALLEKSKEFFSVDPSPYIKGGHAVKFLGHLDSYEIWHGQCEAGSGGPSGAQAVTTDLIDALSPKYILMPGIGFGLKQDNQKIGDVLVSTHVYSYEKQRYGDVIIPRGDKVPSSPTLLSALRMVSQTWKKTTMHFGIVMSGDKLVDNPDFVAQLKKIEPEAIGGEMEAAGIYAAAYRRKVDWIIFKSIVDWGMGKTNEHQEGASLFASEVLFETLKIITK